MMVGGSKAGPRTARRTVGGRTVWIKRFDRPSPPKWDRLQRAAFLLTRIELIQPVPSESGFAGMEHEIEAMRRFCAIGACVPDVLEVRGATIEISDIGETLRAIEGRAGEAGIAGHVALAAAELSRIHRHGLVHGRPILRNLTWNGEAIGFIDFEEQPLKMMSLRAAQARDILLLLMSVGRRSSSALVANVFAAYARQMPPEVEAELWKLSRWARFLTGALGRFLMRTGNLDLAGAVKAFGAIEAQVRLADLQSRE